jgi:hypothetical protein
MNPLLIGSMKLRPLYFLTLLALNICQAHAGGVTLTTSGGSQLASKTGAALPNGCAVRIGSFNLPDATRDATLAATRDYTTLASWFKPLAENTPNAGTAEQPNSTGSGLTTNSFPTAGNMFGTVSDIKTSYMAAGTKLYIWVFNHAEPAKATEWGIFTAPSWLAPQALGSQPLSTSASMQAIQGTAANAQLCLNNIPTSYGNWTWQSYASAPNGQSTDAAADPDADGIANIAEYAWKLNAGSADKTRTDINTRSGSIVFSFKSPRNTPDVNVTVECSPDLKTWAPATSQVVSSDADFDTRECVAAPGARCFWRVRFAAAP